MHKMHCDWKVWVSAWKEEGKLKTVMCIEDWPRHSSTWCTQSSYQARNFLIRYFAGWVLKHLAWMELQGVGHKVLCCRLTLKPCTHDGTLTPCEQAWTARVMTFNIRPGIVIVCVHKKDKQTCLQQLTEKIRLTAGCFVGITSQIAS